MLILPLHENSALHPGDHTKMSEKKIDVQSEINLSDRAELGSIDVVQSCKGCSLNVTKRSCIKIACYVLKPWQHSTLQELQVNHVKQER